MWENGAESSRIRSCLRTLARIWIWTVNQNNLFEEFTA